MFDKTKINEKEAGDGPFKKQFILIFSLLTISAKIRPVKHILEGQGISSIRRKNRDFSLIEK